MKGSGEGKEKWEIVDGKLLDRGWKDVLHICTKSVGSTSAALMKRATSWSNPPAAAQFMGVL